MYKNDNNNHDFITDAVTPCMTGGVESRNDNEHKDIVERDARKAGVEQELEAVASGGRGGGISSRYMYWCINTTLLR